MESHGVCCLVCLPSFAQHLHVRHIQVVVCGSRSFTFLAEYNSIVWIYPIVIIHPTFELFLILWLLEWWCCERMFGSTYVCICVNLHREVVLHLCTPSNGALQGLYQSPFPSAVIENSVCVHLLTCTLPFSPLFLHLWLSSADLVSVVSHHA